METKIGVSTRLSRNTTSTPRLALCVQHDDTGKEITELSREMGKNEYISNNLENWIYRISNCEQWTNDDNEHLSSTPYIL